jgi:hypothetical protein
MGEKVRVGVRNEDGSYTYHYDRSSSLGGRERKNLITGEKNNSYPKKKMPVINRKSGSSKDEKKKMPKARDMAMGDKNISYVGDPFIVDGKVFDPAKEFPETYMRPEGAKTYSKGSKKPVKAVLGVLALGAIGAKALSKAKKKTATATPNDIEYVSNKKNMVTDLYQKATKQETAKMNMGGEVEVMRGGDYIKDLID